MTKNTETPTAPLQALLATLEETLQITDTLINAYRLKLAMEPPLGTRLRHSQLHTLSALRAAAKAKANTKASIRKLRRRMVKESRYESG
ncbi:MAG: hypothetical protein WCK89_14860 [bacterium]